jgi:pyrroline-5-carboxylate reductase
MGKALISGVINQGMTSTKDIYAYDIDESKIDDLCRKSGIQKKDPIELATTCDIIILAVKPQDIESLILKIAYQMDSEKKIIVSIAAGIKVSFYRKYLKKAQLVRVMPNTPALIGKGASVLYFDGSFSETEKDIVLKIFISCGIAEIVKNEELMDCVTGLSGSGPAYVFTFINAFVDAGVMEGLPRETAKKLAVQTVLGSAELAANSIKEGIHLEELKDRVTSPGGTTAAGLFALEEGAFKAIVINAVREATNRSRELGSREQCSKELSSKERGSNEIGRK